MWVYKQTEPGLWTVGYYDPDGIGIRNRIMRVQRKPRNVATI